MYRVVKFGHGKYYALEIDETNPEDAMEDILLFVREGNDVIITDDYEQYDAELVEKD